MLRDRVREAFRAMVTLDLRSLALARVLFGVCILTDLFWRAQNLFAHYADGGVLPRDVLTAEYSPWFISLHAASGTVWWEGALFAVAAVFAVMLIVGYRTRLATVISWIFLISLQNRNPLLLQGGDIVLHLGLFWAIFLPWGRRMSVDAKPGDDETAYRSIAGAVFMLQLGLVYWCNAAAKTDRAWHADGNAALLALMLDQFVTPFGRWLRQFPWLLTASTHAVLFLERVGSIGLFSPMWNGPVRTGVIAVLVVMHLAFGAALDIGTFPWIMVAFLIALLPSWFWEVIVRRLRVKFGPLHPRLVRVRAALQRIASRVAPVHVKIVVPRWRSILRDSMLLVLFTCCVVWSIASIPGSGVVFPKTLRPIMYTLRLDQHWNMFSPYPSLDDGWYIIPGTLVSGQEVDLFRHGRAVTYVKPADIAAEYGDQYWRKYMIRLWENHQTEYRLVYGQYLCRQWNSRHTGEDVVQSFDIQFMREETLRDGTEAAGVLVTIWQHKCF